MIELIIFASTFITVFALGMQSLNVNGGHYLAAFVTSFVIGGSSLVLYKTLPDANILQCAAYLLGGATGIVCAMWVHKRTIGRRKARASDAELTRAQQSTIDRMTRHYAKFPRRCD